MRFPLAVPRLLSFPCRPFFVLIFGGVWFLSAAENGWLQSSVLPYSQPNGAARCFLTFYGPRFNVAYNAKHPWNIRSSFPFATDAVVYINRTILGPEHF